MPLLFMGFIKQIPTILLTAVAMIAYNTFILLPEARKEGYDKRIAEVAVADAKNEAISKGTLSTLQSQSDHDVCVGSLRRKGLPIDPCEQLLGIRVEQPKP